MALKSWLSTLKGDVSALSPVQASNPKGASRNVLETADVSGVSGSGNTGLDDTSDTARARPAYQHQPARSSACTGDAAETLSNPKGSGIKSNVDALEYSNSYCWPHSSAFNSVEVKLTLERLRFLGNRLSEDDAERMADLLIKRDREMLDMTYCFECHHLEGFGSGPWRCNNAIEAEVNISKKISSVPRDWPWMLMRCFGFRGLLDQQKTDE
jgi:hypothetical protein